MSLRVIISLKANNFLKKLENLLEKRIKAKLKELSNSPELGKPLTGKLAGLWSLRIGNYRAIYQIRKSELLVLILKIGHTKNLLKRVQQLESKYNMKKCLIFGYYG